MAFDWRVFFLFAHELRNETQEGKRRTSISRAYYYAYHAALIQAKRLGFIPQAPSLRKMGVHQRLWNWCQSQSDMNLVALGDAGNTLKARRTSADYSASISPSQQDVQKQLDETRDFEILLAKIARRRPPPSP